MPHITSSRVTQYQAQSITCVTICRKFITLFNYLLGFIGNWELEIGYFSLAPCSPTSFLTLPISPVL